MLALSQSLGKECSDFGQTIQVELHYVDVLAAEAHDSLPLT